MFSFCGNAISDSYKMNEHEKIIHQAQLVLPSGILKGGDAAKLSTLYSAFFMVLMEIHIALMNWVDTKSSAVLDRLLNSDAYQKLNSPVINDIAQPKASPIAESSFHLLNPTNRNLIMALTELSLTRSKGEEQLISGYGSSCYKYAVLASECMEEEIDALSKMEQNQQEQLAKLLAICTEKIFGARISVLREKCRSLAIPSRQLSSTSSLEAIREAINYGIGVLKCKSVPYVTIVSSPPEFSNIERRMQMHLNNTELEKTIERETNPMLLAEKLRQLNLMNDEIDKTLQVPSQQLFDIKEQREPEKICSGLFDLQSQCVELCAETMMLKDKLALASKRDHADQVRGTHDQSLQCLNKSATQLKELSKQVSEKRDTLETRIDFFQNNIIFELEKTQNKSELYNIGVCKRAILKALTLNREYTENNLQNIHKRNISSLLERVIKKVKTFIKN
jgi:hypothetical protein